MAGSGLESELLSATGVEWSHSLETGKNNPSVQFPEESARPAPPYTERRRALLQASSQALV